MEKYELKIIMGILILLLFLSAHYLVSIYHFSGFGYLYVIIFSDIFLYSAIIFQIILILLIIRDEKKEMIK